MLQIARMVLSSGDGLDFRHLIYYFRCLTDYFRCLSHQQHIIVDVVVPTHFMHSLQYRKIDISFPARIIVALTQTFTSNTGVDGLGQSVDEVWPEGGGRGEESHVKG